MELKYIDIHSHLNLKPLKHDEEAVVRRMVEHGVGTITIGVDFETSKEAIALAEKYDFIWAGVGMHPTDNTEEVFDKETYIKLAMYEKVVCVGECGLDYYRDQSSETKERQEKLFRQHVQIAKAVGKPLMIHARPSKGSMNAYTDVLNILEDAKKEFPDLRANFHFFVGDMEVAKRALSLGFTMSFDGPITFAREYDEVIKFLPLESILIETDAPFAAPVPYRGKTCEPYMVIEIAKKIAEIKNLPLEDTSTALFQNAQRYIG
ncbi:MAG: TatD family hydrolase [Candidatus Paceibacterota bacterium]